MNILRALVPPILFNLSGLIDTYLTKHLKGKQIDGDLHDSIGTLMIVGGMIAGGVAIVLAILFYSRIHVASNIQTLLLILSGLLHGIAVFPYLKALNYEKVENIVPMLQLIPIFVYILGIFLLGEYLSLTKVLLMLGIIMVTIFFGRNHQTKKFNKKGFLYILLSTLLYACSFALFKLGGNSIEHVGVALFWEHFGIFLASSYRLLHKKTRHSTFHYFKHQGIKIIFLNTSNEIMYIIGTIILNILFLYHPIAVVDTISNSIQPLLLFIMVYFSYKLLPKIFERKYTQKTITQKLIFCGIGAILLSFFILL